MADRYKLVNGERIKLTAKENAERDAEEKAWADGAFDRAIASLRQDRITVGLDTEKKVKDKKFPTKPE